VRRRNTTMTVLRMLSSYLAGDFTRSWLNE
jgi:hypothetical protein